MIKTFILPPLFLCAPAVLSLMCGCETSKVILPETHSQASFSSPFPRGDEFKSDWFSGKVYLNMISPKDELFGCPIGNVTFEPSCYNKWHSHPGGQILLCTAGIGLYQAKGEKAQVLHVGDVVRIAPNVVHWHGATQSNWFAHLSIETHISAGPAQWYDLLPQPLYQQINRELKREIDSALIKNATFDMN